MIDNHLTSGEMPQIDREWMFSRSVLYPKNPGRSGVGRVDTLHDGLALFLRNHEPTVWRTRSIMSSYTPLRLFPASTISSITPSMPF